MARRTLSAIVVFTLILTHILCMYEAIATCGYNDPEARDRALQDALVDLGKKEATLVEREKDLDKAEEAMDNFKKNSRFFMETVLPIVTKGWWKLLGGAVLGGPTGVIAGGTWEFIVQMREDFEEYKKLDKAESDARLDRNLAKTQRDNAQKKVDALRNHKEEGIFYNKSSFKVYETLTVTVIKGKLSMASMKIDGEHVTAYPSSHEEAVLEKTFDSGDAGQTFTVTVKVWYDGAKKISTHTSMVSVE